jgi:hypothetical protein
VTTLKVSAAFFALVMSIANGSLAFIGFILGHYGIGDPLLAASIMALVVIVINAVLVYIAVESGLPPPPPITPPVTQVYRRVFNRLRYWAVPRFR